MFRIFSLIFLLAFPAFAQEEDINSRLNTAIASKLGALEISNSSLAIQIEIVKKELADIRKKCGDPCNADKR